MASATGPTLWMFWGIGTALRGFRDRRLDESYVATVWFHILFIPIIPFQSYRVLRGQEQTVWIPGVYSRSKIPFVILDQVPTSARHVLAVYSIIGLIALAIASWIWIDIQDRENSAALKRDAALTLLQARPEFAEIKLGRLEGEQIAQGSTPQREGILRQAKAESDHREACLQTCAAYDACVGFQVGRFKGGSRCAIFRTIAKAIPDPHDAVGGDYVFSLRKAASPSVK